MDFVLYIAVKSLERSSHFWCNKLLWLFLVQNTSRCKFA